MAFLIDSDWAIDYLNQDPRAIDLISGLGPQGTFISIMTYIEVFQGTLRDPDFEKAQQALQDFTASSPVLDLGVPVAERCARIRQALLDQGKRPARRGFDLVIAATAIEYNLRLVTRNVRDDADIPGLRLYEASTQA